MPSQPRQTAPETLETSLRRGSGDVQQEEDDSQIPGHGTGTGQVVPDAIMEVELRTQDGSTTTLNRILEHSTDGIIVCVYSRVSRRLFAKEFDELAQQFESPKIRLTSVGLSTYPVSINASILDASACSVDETYYLLSDPTCRILGPIGHVRPAAGSKAWATRLRRQGRIKCGYLIVQKNKTVYARQAGPLESVAEGIFRAARRMERQQAAQWRQQGRVLTPW